jgi:hypothetical protein
MLAVIYLLGMFIADLFKSRRRLELENLFLRHQLNIALREAPKRLRLWGRSRAGPHPLRFCGDAEIPVLSMLSIF